MKTVMRSPRFLLVAVLLTMGSVTMRVDGTTGIPVLVTASVPEVATQSLSVWDTMTNWGQWLEDRVEQLNQLTELIENNSLTEAIRGFNELMTSIQTDISEVLGTVETLVSAPMEIMETLMEIPGTMFEMVGGLQSGAGGFMGLYERAMGIFSIVGDMQAFGTSAAGDLGGLLENAGGSYGLMNQMGGMRTKMASSYLGGSRERTAKLRSFDKGSYGQDAIQMASTTNDLLLEVVRQNYMAQEMGAMETLSETAERMAIQTQLRARSGKTATQTQQNFYNQLNF